MTPPIQNPDSCNFDDHRMEAIMGRLLQVGVTLASAVVLFGGVLYLHQHADAAVNLRTFSAETAQLVHPAQLIHQIAAWDGAAIIQLGVLLLIATPVARVAFAIVGFAIERDRLYAAISLLIFTVLIIGLLRSS